MDSFTEIVPYRDLLERETGERSAKDLSVTQAGRVIDKLREVTGERGGTRGAVAGLEGVVSAKLRALWISGYNLAIVRDRSDRAMLAFLQRQTGVSHTRFLKDPRAALGAIEGLKSWLGRAAKVQWPADNDDVTGAKRAVLNAQWARLIELGEVKAIGQAVDPVHDLMTYAGRIVRQNRWETFQLSDYDQVQKALGHKLRGALARRAVRADGDGESR